MGRAGLDDLLRRLRALVTLPIIVHTVYSNVNSTSNIRETLSTVRGTLRCVGEMNFLHKKTQFLVFSQDYGTTKTHLFLSQYKLSTKFGFL